MQRRDESAFWSELGQWCWTQMLALKRVWKVDLPCDERMPSPELEKLIDRSVSRLLHDPEKHSGTPNEHRPWVLARFVFGSGLLQPRNLRLLEIRAPSEPSQALGFLLREEWHQTGRERWPSTALYKTSRLGPDISEGKVKESWPPIPQKNKQRVLPLTPTKSYLIRSELRRFILR